MVFKKKNKCENCNGDLKKLQDLTKKYNELKWIKIIVVDLIFFNV